MATVWPLMDEGFADALNSSTGSLQARCPEIVSNIDILTSANALSAARSSDGTLDLSGDGPFLLAWSPAARFGEPQEVVLMLNLSNVTNVSEATRQFADWAVKIEQDPSLWQGGWDRERLRTVIRQWADKYGSSILNAFGLS